VTTARTPNLCSTPLFTTGSIEVFLTILAANLLILHLNVDFVAALFAKEGCHKISNGFSGHCAWSIELKASCQIDANSFSIFYRPIQLEIHIEKFWEQNGIVGAGRGRREQNISKALFEYNVAVKRRTDSTKAR
jgi:hypothetical protein